MTMSEETTPQNSAKVGDRPCTVIEMKTGHKVYVADWLTAGESDQHLEAMGKGLMASASAENVPMENILNGRKKLYSLAIKKIENADGSDMPVSAMENLPADDVSVIRDYIVQHFEPSDDESKKNS